MFVVYAKKKKKKRADRAPVGAVLVGLDHGHLPTGKEKVVGVLRLSSVSVCCL